MMWCVVPVAGRATRLATVVQRRPKALLDINGRSVLDRLLECLTDVVTDVCLVVGDHGDAIREEMGAFRYGIRVHYVTQSDPCGVADAVLRTRDLARPPIAVVMGDVYYDEPLTPYIESWERSGADGAVLVEPVSEGDEGSMGLVTLKGDRVESITKEDFAGQSAFRLCGLAVLPGRAFDADPRFRSSETGEFELEDMIAWLLSEGFEFAAVPYRGWRRNINTPADLRSVEARLTRNFKPSVSA